jgi:hypothetical protein
MSIATESRQVKDWRIATVTACVLTATGDSGCIWDFFVPVTILRVGVQLTVACVAVTTLPHIRFDRRILADSDVGRISGLNAAADGMVIVPTGTAIGVKVYKDVRVDMNPGDQIIPTVTIAATGGGSAGQCKMYVEYINRAEIPQNFPLTMVQSA